ncbi:MAG: hypothetical protein AAF411_09090 [Myxococcota bacterium]
MESFALCIAIGLALATFASMSQPKTHPANLNARESGRGPLKLLALLVVIGIAATAAMKLSPSSAAALETMVRFVQG